LEILTTADTKGLKLIVPGILPRNQVELDEEFGEELFAQ
jgi:hypothetical protein